MKSVLYVGLDVHKDSIAIAVAHEGREPAETWKTIPYDGVRLRKALKMLVKAGEELRVCYEAGPTGLVWRALRPAFRRSLRQDSAGRSRAWQWRCRA